MSAPPATQFSVVWIDAEAWPRVASNPDYPKGKDVDATGGTAGPSCTVPLPYPARRIGAYVIECRLCGLRAGVTTAGRPDDPRSVRMACKTQGTA